MKIRTLVILLFTVLTLSAQDRMADDFVTVSLVVADPGNRFFSTVGHACLRMQCPTYDLDYCFSYETTTMPHKLLRYARGGMTMGMVPIYTDAFLDCYAADQRGVSEYVLNLPAEVKTNLWRILDSIAAYGMTLKYDYIERGCAITCIDCIDLALGNSHIQYDPEYCLNGMTIREIMHRHWYNQWTAFFAMSLVGGSAVDSPLIGDRTLVVPADLRDAWLHATLDRKPLVSEVHTLLPSLRDYSQPIFSPLVVTILLLLIASLNLCIKSKAIDITMLTAQTLWGIVATTTACLVYLSDTGWNWLLVFLNPLPAIFWRWRQHWAIPYTALMLVWGICMLSAKHLYADPAHLIAAMAFCLVALKEKIQTQLLKRHNTNTQITHKNTNKKENI